MIEAVDEHREVLEALADRDDLMCSRYAKVLVKAVEN